MYIGINELKKDYINQSKKSIKVLKGVSLHIDKGEFIAVMGASGSGKSTFLKILGGLESITSGTVEFNKEKLENFSEKDLDNHRKNTIGFVFQNFNLIDALTVNENILLPLTLDKNIKINSKHVREKVFSMLNYIDIDKIQSNYPSEISGGEQQRTAICRALIKNPEIILADEPTGNLDSYAASKVLNLLYKINEEQKKTIIMVTHDNFSASFCSRVILFKDGRNIKEIKKNCEQEEFANQISYELNKLRMDDESNEF